MCRLCRVECAPAMQEHMIVCDDNITVQPTMTVTDTFVTQPAMHVFKKILLGISAIPLISSDTGFRSVTGSAKRITSLH